MGGIIPVSEHFILNVFGEIYKKIRGFTSFFVLTF